MAKKKKVEETKEIVNVEEPTTQETQKSLDEMTLAEIRDFYDKECEEYKKRVQTVNSVDELLELEKELMKEYDSHEEIISNRSYPLADDIAFNGRRITRAGIGQIICRFLNKMEVQYNQVLGMWQLSRWWKTPEKSIGYGAYDSTVRILGLVKYTGVSEWENLMAVIEYLKTPNDIYGRDILRGDFIAKRHNEILSRMDLLNGHTAAADALEGLPYNPTDENAPKELIENQ